MHYSEIDHEVKIEEPSADLDGDYGYRPILLEGFTPVDGSDVIVPVDSDSPESFTLALTEEQGVQALLALAEQIGDLKARDLVNELITRNGS
jgi:hypothetical protein